MNRRLRAFLWGTAHAFDLFGTLGPEYPVCLTVEEAWAADCAALRADWEAVGADLRHAAGQAESAEL